MNLSLLDTVVFFTYFIGVVLFAVLAAGRSKTKSSADFFLASRKMPWYVVGASFIASNISTEHFIGMVGWGFLYGIAVAHWEWGNVLTFSVLIWVFLPFYMRGNISTMPEFLEKRFNKACRYIYAIVMIVGLVIAMLGGVLFAGAKAINVFFPQIPICGGILILAVAAGTYTIYGGLLSAMCADLLQYILLMAGGIVVALYGLYYSGGFGDLFERLPEKFIMLYPRTHEMIPWTGLIMGFFSVGIWYSCANQFIVQRCLGARSEWDGRMGVIILLIGVTVGLILSKYPAITVFQLIQTVFFYVAPPISASFLLGILWPRITPTAAMLTMILGFVVYLPLTVKVFFKQLDFLQPYDNFMHHTFVVFMFSVVTLIVVSLFTRPKSREQLTGVIWTKSALGIGENKGCSHRGFKSLKFWWVLMVLTILSCYVFSYYAGSKTEWLEAENMAYQTTQGTTARLQSRSELVREGEKFNLWTGKGQVLFMPEQAGDRITFELPIEKKGNYEIAALVTQGPDYGKFTAEVNGKQARIRYTQFKTKEQGYGVVEISRSYFDGHKPLKEQDEKNDRFSGVHTVRRISLGTFYLEENLTSVCFIYQGESNESHLIGIDQLMMTRQ